MAEIYTCEGHAADTQATLRYTIHADSEEMATAAFLREMAKLSPSRKFTWVRAKLHREEGTRTYTVPSLYSLINANPVCSAMAVPEFLEWLEEREVREFEIARAKTIMEKYGYTVSKKGEDDAEHL